MHRFKPRRFENVRFFLFWPDSAARPALRVTRTPDFFVSIDNKDATGSASIARTQVTVSSSIPFASIMLSATTWSRSCSEQFLHWAKFLPTLWRGYISSTCFGEFRFTLRDQSGQESEGAFPVSLRDKNWCVEVYTDHPHGAGCILEGKDWSLWPCT